jgi:Ca2+-binding EF-hand superfamily protein
MQRLLKFKGQTLLKRAAMNVLVKHLSPKDVVNIKNQFEKLDVHQNGYLLYEDLERAVKDSGFNLSRKEMDQLLKEVDFEKNNKIKYTEFLAATIDTQELLTEAKL